MENLNGRLEDLVKKAKTSNSARKEGAKLLTAAFAESNDYGFVVDGLMKFHYSVSGLFFEHCKLTDEEANGIVNAFVKHKKFQSAKMACSRGFQMCSSFLKSNQHKQASAVMAVKVISVKDKSGGFAGDIFENFKQYIIESKQLDAFIALQDVLENDIEKQTFNRFLSKASRQQNTAAGFSQPTPATVESKMPDAAPSANASPVLGAKPVEDRMQQIILEHEAILGRLTEQVGKLADTNGVISSLRSAIGSKERENSVLNQEITRLKGEMSSISAEKQRLTERIGKFEAEIADLKARLKSVFQIDASIKSQEIETLRKNVSEALKAEYEEYHSSDSTVFNEDNFEANCASLQRIFKILKRFKFNLE